mmetsp:Transcript_54163/g.89892  ORF Transcript_54163/g.89892 Transcript_54163/m.89892 type:complete len:436 (-) Transcript_54163:478-1785(-)|eukprot:CAMPEP_0119304634 /NCGR_PEP_ID=MMETSP1333-20130426/5805_1 /TAXON_ID=418940 /ORGANISM="Scyphosphaera apsteinii, Strain RCC1455" /LENGTH=435 /DNA_ID=CAMNT_0007307553 /DNA_START=276 /DNA_END=1586 /DNA_ORIENTATION=-
MAFGLSQADQDFAKYGKLAGPPPRPFACEVGSTMLTLRWSCPLHTGGHGVDVIGYRLFVQIGGDSGFEMHTPDTGSADVEMLVEGLKPSTWYEFRVAALTVSGLGHFSPTSRPVLTQHAPRHEKLLQRATEALARTKAELAQKQDTLLLLARAPPVAAQLKERQLQREQLQREVGALELKLKQRRRAVLALQDEQVDRQSKHSHERHSDTSTPGDIGRFNITRHDSSVQAQDAWRRASLRGKAIEALGAYNRLFVADEKREPTYTNFDREAALKKLLRALSIHVLADGDMKKSAYFTMVLNRCRSALTHNVIDCFADRALERLALVFGRFDADHDGVLDFDEFCRLMLLVGSQLHKHYTEQELRRMFNKADVNSDKAIDLNELLLLHHKAGDAAASLADQDLNEEVEEEAGCSSYETRGCESTSDDCESIANCSC